MQAINYNSHLDNQVLPKSSIFMRRTVFCELEFLNGFAHKLYGPQTDDDEIIRIRSFFKFIKTSYLCLNITANEFNENVETDIFNESTQSRRSENDQCREWNQLLRKILNELYIANISNGTVIHTNAFSGSISQIFDDHSKDFDKILFNAVYLTSLDRESCEALSKQHGIFVFNIEMVETMFDEYQYFETTVTTINNVSDFNFLNPFSHNCNSMIIVDRFIFRHNEVWLDNLRTILQKIIPNGRRNEPFYLTFVTQYPLPPVANNIAEFKDDIERKCKLSVQNMINKICCRNWENTVRVFYTNRFHDRYIITNNMLLDIGKGFDWLFDRNAEGAPVMFNGVSTAINFYPAFVRNNKTRYEYWNLLSVIRNEVIKRNVLSVMKNRLLNLD